MASAPVVNHETRNAHLRVTQAPQKMLIGLLIVVVVLALLFVSLYNRLVSLRVRAQNAWSDIDVQLKRRADLVPNLVSTVKGYAAHERGTLDAVTQARTRAVAAFTSRRQRSQSRREERDDSQCVRADHARPDRRGCPRTRSDARLQRVLK